MMTIKGAEELLLCLVPWSEGVKGFERGGVHCTSCQVIPLLMVEHNMQTNKQANK